jgi:H/ACA ribonucleoprotein complex subunit 3
MSQMLRKCTRCGKYSLHTVCPFCGSETKSAHPMKFSITDRFGKYRRKLKRVNVYGNENNHEKETKTKKPDFS